MLDPFPDDYIVNISDIINLEEAYLYSKFMITEIIVNAISSIFYMIIIFFHTPESMKNFKKLMLFYVINVMITDFGAVFLRFTLLMPFQIVFPLGILGPLNIWQSIVAISVAGFGTTNTFDTLLLIFLERHFTVAKIIAPEHMKFKKIIYDSLLMVPKNTLLIWSIAIVLSAYIGVRVLIDLYMLYYGYKFGKASQNHFSKRTREGLVIMLRILIVQFITVIFVIIIPIVILALFFLFFSIVPQTLLSSCICLLGIFPTLDTWLSLILIKPYRMAVVRLFTSGRIRPIVNINGA
ncbi:hypothetical protein FO519_009976 [Halicephalobus sp. NKZ332]|nr:hypothetical protein FO519_009976 [Halicephalobus sp. NKZ332]